MTAFKLTEVKANLFHVPQTQSLAHSVTTSFQSERGSLAWQFNVIFGRADELRQQQLGAGNVAVLEDNGRFVYYLVTKPEGHTITYDALQSALICMREHMRNHGVLKVAMPRIGCGHDQLNWQRVRDIILQLFHNEYGVEILICRHRSPVLPTLPRCDIVEVKGNILSAPSDHSLVHTVSADFAMCGSVGLQFKCKFGQVNELIKQNKHTGNVAVLKDNDRYIYNLITKDRNHERCTYSALYYAIVAMREHMLQHGVTKLAIPRLGCGIDRLDWQRVKKILEFVFASDRVEIVTYLYDPPVVVSRQSLGVVHKLKPVSRHSNCRQMSTAAERGGAGYQLREVEGDLFGAPASHSLAHCVAADMGMGAGIAVRFKALYGQVDELLAQGAQSDGVAVLQDKQRYIYYLVTKPSSWGSPTYDSLRASLCAMREHMRSNGVRQLAIPRIGCGIDGLEWDKVRAELQGVFGNETDVEIVVYNFVPK